MSTSDTEKTISTSNSFYSIDQLTKMLNDTTVIQYSPDCIRKKTNWSKASPKYRFDHPKFKLATVLRDMPTHSPKLEALLKNIKQLDHRDQTKYGHTFKHFIFSDLKSAPYGAKMIASALIADGMHLGYSAKPMYDFSIRQDQDSDDDSEEDEVDGGASVSNGGASVSDGDASVSDGGVSVSNGGAKKSAWGPIELDGDDVLRETQSDNFYLLASTSVYEKPISVKMKKQILSKFNQRPENIYGEMARIIVMDSGFKEGIDLFDVKYVHIFEPPVNHADQKQVIGRGTRTCGQRGLPFDAKRGWPLHVFIYDMSIPEEYRDSFLGASSTFELYVKSLNMDARLIQFSKEVERITVIGSVDYELNKKIHHFAIEPEEDEIYGGLSVSDRSASLKTGGEAVQSYETTQLVKSMAQVQIAKGGKNATKKNRKKSPSPPLTLKRIQEIHNLRDRISFVDTRNYKSQGFTRKKGDKFMYVKNRFAPLRFDSTIRSPSMSPIEDIIPPFEGVPNHDSIRQYVHEYYRKFTWDDIKMENLCGSAKGGANPELIKYTPTQDFIKHYFTPQCPVKGMLLWHSVGTGKTCSAIAAASSSFESQGYTILWVTRTTLKNDIWKNMFSQVCNEPIRQKIAKSQIESFPKEIQAQMKLLGPAWRIRPISYKQFSNLVSQQNDYYKRLVKENGEEDPLRKTLLIIDEAHKLYGGGDLSSIERPDMEALKTALLRSYAISGENSVRLLLMTATPITENPMEIVQLANLCKPADQQIPATFNAFSEEYLDEGGQFTESGERRYLDAIAGHISYLNREKDARQFAQPIVRNIVVPLVPDTRSIDLYDKYAVKAQWMKMIHDAKAELDKHESKLEAELKDINVARFAHLQKICEDADLAISKKDCMRIVKSNIQELLKEAKAYIAEIKNQSKNLHREYKILNDEKGKRLNHIKANIEKHPEDYQGFKDGIFYMIKSMCSTKMRTNADIQEKLQRDHHIETINTAIEECKERIHTAEMEMKIFIESHRARIRHIKKVLATDPELIDIERNVLNQIVTEDRKTFAKTNRENTRKNKEIIESVDQELKDLEKTKKERITYIRKTLKQRLTSQKKEKNKIDKIRKNMHKTMRKEGKLLTRFNDEFLSDLQEKYEDKIEIDLLQEGEDQIEKQEEALKMAEVKHLAKVEKAQAKQLEKAEKDRIKQLEKAEKAQAKHLAKVEKDRIKQLEKAEKDRIKALKKTKKNI